MEGNKLKIRKLKRKDIKKIMPLLESLGVSLPELVDMFWPELNRKMVVVVPESDRSKFMEELEQDETALSQFEGMSKSDQDALIITSASQVKMTEKLISIVKTAATSIDEVSDNLDIVLASVCDTEVEVIQDLDLDEYWKLIVSLVKGLIGKN